MELAACFDRLREYVLNKKLLYRDDCIQNLVCKMVITAAQCCPSAFDKSRGDANMCAAAIKYISGNLSERLSLYDIAGKFGFSEGHFSRLFQKSVGISYNEYVTRLRVNARYTLTRRKRKKRAGHGAFLRVSKQLGVL